MSMERPVTVTCPQCGKEFSTTIWQSLNRDLDPEAADELMNGGIFHYECPHCKNKGPFYYPMLYNDMKASTMIQYVGMGRGESYQDALERGRQQRVAEREALEKNGLGNLMKRIKSVYRIVVTPQDLMEKARLLRDGLDDRAMEIMKYKVLSAMKKSKPDISRDRIQYFSSGKEEFLFVCSIDGQEDMITSIKKAPYTSILEQLQKNLLGFEENNDWVVDLAWAKAAIDRMLDSEKNED